MELAHRALNRDNNRPSKGDEGYSVKDRGRMLVLASETIYSPENLGPFVNNLLGLLRGQTDGADMVGEREWEEERGNIALVAAKKIYFGVGGGVDEFVEMVEGKGAMVRKVWDSEEGEGLGERKSGGVGRCILEVRTGKR